jgi:hypothetical protein
MVVAAASAGSPTLGDRLVAIERDTGKTWIDDLVRHSTFGTRRNYELRYIFGLGMAMQMVK